MSTREKYPPIDYLHGKTKPEIIEVDGKFRVQLTTTYPDTGRLISLGVFSTVCPHHHNTRKAAERCLRAWNDYAYEERRKLIRAGNGAFYGS